MLKTDSSRCSRLHRETSKVKTPPVNLSKWWTPCPSIYKSWHALVNEVRNEVKSYFANFVPSSPRGDPDCGTRLFEHRHGPRRLHVARGTAIGPPTARGARPSAMRAAIGGRHCPRDKRDRPQRR